MKIEGHIISGAKEGAYFMALDVYKNQFKDKLGFEPFSGTLNVKVKVSEASKIFSIPDKHFGIINGSGNFGDVKFVTASLNSLNNETTLNNIDGALIFPVKTHHPKDVLEFIAPLNLRKNLNLKDGDMVTIIF